MGNEYEQRGKITAFYTCDMDMDGLRKTLKK